MILRVIAILVAVVLGLLAGALGTNFALAFLTMANIIPGMRYEDALPYIEGIGLVGGLLCGYATARHFWGKGKGATLTMHEGE